MGIGCGAHRLGFRSSSIDVEHSKVRHTSYLRAEMLERRAASVRALDPERRGARPQLDLRLLRLAVDLRVVLRLDVPLAPERVARDAARRGQNWGASPA